MSNKTINLINKTHLAITKQNVVSPTQYILITISGGQDSLCLFFILLHLKKQWKWHFGLSYCNHFWQIDSFHTNSLVLKLGFFFLIPAYLSLPSENIFSEQKSRTWRYRQFERLSNFYKYEIIFTGHTSTDRIETVLLQLLRGTGTRGLSTLDWIRPLSRDKSPVSKCSSEVLAKLSFPLCVSIKNNKPANIVKNNNLSLYEEFFQIKFCNQFLLRSQISCLKTNFFYEIRTTKLPLTQRFEQDFRQIVAKNLNKVLLEKQSFVNDTQSSFQRLSLHLNLPLPLLQPSFLTLFLQSLCFAQTLANGKVTMNQQNTQANLPDPRNLVSKICLITKEKGLTKMSKITNSAFKSSFFPLKEKSYGTKLRRNTVALQRDLQGIYYRNINWIYDKFFFLTLEKTPILTPFYKLNYSYCKKSLLLRSEYNTQYLSSDDDKIFFRLMLSTRLSPSEVRNQENGSRRPFNFLSSYNSTRKLINLSSRQIQQLSQLKINPSSVTLPVLLISLLERNSRTFPTSFFRSSSFIISRRIIFRGYFVTRQVSTVVDKIKFLFSLTSKDKLKSNVKPIFKHSILSQKDTCSSFIFKTVILNKKPSKVLIKYLKISYWVEFRKNFIELEVFKLKNILNFEITPFLIKSYFFLSHYQQAVIRRILYPFATLSFWDKAVGIEMIFYNLASSKQGSGIQAKLVNLTTKVVSSLGKEKKDLTSIEKMNLVLNVDSLHTHEKKKKLALFLDTNQKLEPGFFLSPTYNLKSKRHNWGENSFFCQSSIIKENIFKETQNTAKSSNTAKCSNKLHLVARTKAKIVINCHQLSLKNRTKNLLQRNFLLLNKPIYKIKDSTILSSLGNYYDFIYKINTNGRLILPNQKEFSWQHKKTNKCFVVRPLLFMTRFDLKKLCAFWQLPIYPDRTNQKLVYFRNRIRKQLLPLLRFFFNPQIDKLFLQFAEIANTEQLYLEGVSTHLQQEFQITKTNTFEINLSVFNFIPMAIQRRLLKQFLNQYFTKQIKFFHIQILLNVLAKRKKSPSTLYDKFRDNDNLISRENFEIRYQMLPKVIFSESLNILPAKEKKFLETPKVPNLPNKIRSGFLKHYIFVRQCTSTKSKLRRNLVSLDKKIKGRNIFSGKNKLETPQILFFAGVGACFITSRRFILLSNFLIV